jgi:2-hydroxychromene-2-carboxylate isomerase
MIEFFFDCSSPWTYLAFHNIQPMAQEIDVPLRWRPILVGGVFNSVNPSVYAQRESPVPAKLAYMHKDIQDWARFSGLTITMPPTVFPVNSVKVMRACIWLLEHDGAQKMQEFARAVFETYWTHDQDISQDAVIDAFCKRCGIDAPQLLQGITAQAIKDQLKGNTEELVRRGGFGSPTIFVGDDMYFGNDRIALVRAAAIKKKVAAPVR